MCDGTARIRHQELKCVELARGKTHFSSGLLDASANRVEHNRADCKRYLRRNCGSSESPDRCANPGCQLAYLKWLCYIVIGAGLQSFHFVIFAVTHSQHENRQPGKDASDPAAGFDSSHTRHVDI